MNDDIYGLLEKLPASVQIDESIAWLNLNKYEGGYQAGYLHGDGIYEKNLLFDSPNAVVALGKLRKAISEYCDGTRT